MWEGYAYYSRMGPYPHQAIQPSLPAGFRSDNPIGYVYPADVLDSGDKYLDPEPDYNPSVSDRGEKRQSSFDEACQPRRAITEPQACFDYPQQAPMRPHSADEGKLADWSPSHPGDIRESQAIAPAPVESLLAKTGNQNPKKRKREASPCQRGRGPKRKRPRLKKPLDPETQEQIPVSTTEVGAL